MGHHIDDQGRFQSDKHPELPPDRIRLSFMRPESRRALRVLADDYRAVDADLSDDIDARLDALGLAGDNPIQCFGCETTGAPVIMLAVPGKRGVYGGLPTDWPTDWVLLCVQGVVMAFCGEDHAADFFKAWLDANRQISHSALGEELAVESTARVIKRYAAKSGRGPGVDQSRRDYLKGKIMSGCCRLHADQAYNAGWKESTK